MKSRRNCCTVGKFEAFHRGHRKLIDTAKTLCDSVKVISIRGKGRRLFTDEERREIADQLGIELVNVPFNEIKELSPRQFFNRLKEYGCNVLVVGEDWRFGKNRSGNVETARKLGKELGIEVVTVPVEKENGKKIGASRILKLLSEGNLEEANELLGFPYFVIGNVVRGSSRGKKLGFPTVNVKPLKDLPIPFGVYAVNLQVGNKAYRGIANYGTAPTLKMCEPIVEVFIPEARIPNLYGKNVKVEFLKFFRPEKKFDTVEELVSQIKLDLENLKDFWRLEVGTGD